MNSAAVEASAGGGSVGMLPKENLDSLRSLLVTQSISQQSTCAIFYV